MSFRNFFLEMLIIAPQLIVKKYGSVFGSISSSLMPDGNLNYNDLLGATEKLFQKIYPDEEFFPDTPSPENPNSKDDVGLALETCKCSAPYCFILSYQWHQINFNLSAQSFG